MDRRNFLQITATGAAALVAARGPQGNGVTQSRPETKVLRTITYNILAARGYPERPENRDRLRLARPQMPDRLSQELALYEADLITFQESPPEPIVTQIAARLGMSHVYFPGGFPGTLLTNLPLLESTNCPLANQAERPGDLFTRHWGRAVLLWDDRKLVVYSAHLMPGNEEIRAREITEMLAVMSDDLNGGSSVILQGDLNHTPDHPGYQRWLDAGLQDAFQKKGTGQGLTSNSTNRKSRIDYVWSAGPVADQLVSCQVLDEGAFIDHQDDPAGFALSDHLPVMATFGQ